MSKAPPKRKRPAKASSKPSPAVDEGDDESARAAFLDKHFGGRRPLMHYYLEAYRATGHPMFIWDAFLLARALKLEIPDEVLAYLEECGIQLFRSTTKDEIVRSLGILPKKGRSSQFVDEGLDKASFEAFLLDSIRKMPLPTKERMEMFRELMAGMGTGLTSTKQRYYAYKRKFSN